MNIEAGKYYKTRDGRKVGPMNVPPKNTTWSSIVKYDTIVDNVWRGWCDGGLYRTYNGEHGLDLIAEWTDDQIGTLAELEVKPGDVVEWYGNGNRKYKVDTHGIPRHDDGGWIDPRCSTEQYRLISRAKPSIDLTAITTPFGLLDKATQDALIAHGGPYQYFWGDAWFDTKICRNVPGYVHRVKPGHLRLTVTKDAAVLSNGSIVANPTGKSNCTITYDTIDGKIDMATYRVTKK